MIKFSFFLFPLGGTLHVCKKRYNSAVSILGPVKLQFTRKSFSLDGSFEIWIDPSLQEFLMLKNLSISHSISFFGQKNILIQVCKGTEIKIGGNETVVSFENIEFRNIIDRDCYDLFTFYANEKGSLYLKNTNFNGNGNSNIEGAQFLQAFEANRIEISNIVFDFPIINKRVFDVERVNFFTIESMWKRNLKLELDQQIFFRLAVVARVSLFNYYYG